MTVKTPDIAAFTDIKDSDKQAEEAFNATHDPDAASTDDDEDDDEDEQTSERKGPPEWTQVSIAGRSDVADAVNFPGQLMSVRASTGTVDIAYELKVRGSAEPTLVQQLAENLAPQTFTAVFAGKVAGSGAVIRNFRCAVDADGYSFCDVTIRVQPSDIGKAGALMRLIKKAAILALEPEQLSLDLARRAE